MVRNAEEHGQSENPTAFAAGFFRTQKRVSFAVADTGRGILRSLRRKRVANDADDDASAIDKALQLFVTGAGPIGDPKAPDNAGLGLYTTRTYAQECGGEMLIWSGGARFHERGSASPVLGPTPSRWQGTLVFVTLIPERVGTFAPRHAGLTAPQVQIKEMKTAPDDAVVLTPPVDASGFAANKSWYREHRDRIQREISAGRRVHIDFGGAIYTTQSALHAFLFEPVRVLGLRAVEGISYSGAGRPLQAALDIVAAYALAEHRVGGGSA